eukprot:PITA_35293
MYCDYRALNKKMVRNRYPLPLAVDCFDKLAKARAFSKLDLRHGYYQGYIRMEPSRVKAIEDWVEPKNVHDMRAFVGMTNYQQKFVEGYSKITSAPIDLLKKDKKWCWTEKCQKAFDDLKRRIVTAPILKLPDFGRPFEVHTDASDFSIGGVLMQDGHPVAYESRKLQDRE